MSHEVSTSGEPSACSLLSRETSASAHRRHRVAPGRDKLPALCAVAPCNLRLEAPCAGTVRRRPAPPPLATVRDNRQMCDPRHTADGGSPLQEERLEPRVGGLHDAAVDLSVLARLGGKRTPSVMVGEADRADRGGPEAQSRCLRRGSSPAPFERASRSIHRRARAATARPIARTQAMSVFFSLPVEMLCAAVVFIGVMAGMLAAAPE